MYINKLKSTVFLSRLLTLPKSKIAFFGMKMEDQKPDQNHHNNPQEKRGFDNNANIQNSNYFKMRAVLKDLRPHFVEVLRTPDFQNSKAACEIGQQMRLLMSLYKEMTSDTVTLEKCKTEMDGAQSLSDEIQDEKKPADVRRPSEERPAVLNNAEKLLFEDVKVQGSYIVGGSAFGWNFITFPTTKLSTYYGRTKEAFRAANPVSKSS